MAKAMIITVGGTPPPIVKSICEYKPEFVSFFASQDTSDLIKIIKDETFKNGVAIKSELTLADDVNDLFHCHSKADEAVMRVLNKGYNKDDVIVDYTGGTKNMSVSLALAAITHGFCFSYVGGKERTKNGVGIVINGQEKVYPCINPWDFLAIEEKKKTALLFNRYQFKAAKELINALCAKNIRDKSLFKRLGIIVDGYHKWDLFRHKDAIERFERAKIDELKNDSDVKVRTFTRETEERLVFLRAAVTAGNNGRKPCLSYMMDLYANAERRYEEGKTDDAILRIYRIVEMGAQERLLSRYSINVSDVKTGQIPEKMRDEFVRLYKTQRDGKIKIPQTAAFDLLDFLGDELGIIFKARKSSFLDMQNSRNYSYLAHGFESAKESTYISLRDFVLSLELFKRDDVPVFPKMVL